MAQPQFHTRPDQSQQSQLQPQQQQQHQQQISQNNLVLFNPLHFQEEWKNEAQRVAHNLEQLKKHLLEKNKKIDVANSASHAPLRVNQLDAQILDKELLEIIKIQFMRIFAFFKVCCYSMFPFNDNILFIPFVLHALTD